ncbi:TPA: host cell division inhibitor Icd-like protein [Citrobacter freundii]
MAKPQCNQTRPEFTWLFLAVSRANMQDKPHREEITAASEYEARKCLAGRYVLSFAGRLPVTGAHHA